ncbi:MAG TPA: Crp/Fnr family transcriptional regulator [Rhodobacteraceae bacterium]|jgi:CRP/FNR family cyclic AMP-dependent transcriptional regulator|nr:Crp/Fnr family transcriptional regulator [Paracoccaceae bacterium]HBG99479.1 Crp/Fnr family transcriptional regulator [Paracoccaceae bacterium]
MPPTKRLILTAQHRLSKTGWFAEQAEDFQDRMKTLARWRNYRAGESLFEVGDTPDAVFGLEQGRLDVAIPISGDEMVNIWRAQSGFWIGDSALLAEKTRGVSVTAHGDCLVLVLPALALRRHLDETPGDIACFFRLADRNMMLALQVLSEVLNLPPRARFARLLLRLTSDAGVVQRPDLRLPPAIKTSFNRVLQRPVETNGH